MCGEISHLSLTRSGNLHPMINCLFTFSYSPDKNTNVFCISLIVKSYNLIIDQIVMIFTSLKKSSHWESLCGDWGMTMCWAIRSQLPVGARVLVYYFVSVCLIHSLRFKCEV